MKVLPLSARTRRRFVIFAQPKEYGNRPNVYYCRSGGTTSSRSQAAQFDSEVEAEDFALSTGIKLTIMTYVGAERFADSEIERLPASTGARPKLAKKEGKSAAGAQRAQL
jgi:hypothetical protein